MRRNPLTRRRVAVIALLVLLFGPLQACYYMQAIRGHSELMHRRRPVSEVIDDRNSPDELKRRLQLVVEARQFAVDELLLPDNDSYRTYADLGRDYVVWNVFAAPEFSLQPKTWCYPVAGCVAYRGYFSERSARNLAAKLRVRGFDVAVGGVAAYSTLGRFADPVLNTMLRWSDVDLVATIFHELAHQKLYVKGDSAFNESFATAVADFGLESWLRARGEGDRLAAYKRSRDLRREVMARVAVTRDRLAELYAREIDPAAMRNEKQCLLDDLSAEAGRLIRKSGSSAPNWLAPPLNNARLVSLNLYEGRLDAFEALLATCQDSLACFYGEAERLARLPQAERESRLDEITATR
jgi:predicted aminopeptidase